MEEDPAADKPRPHGIDASPSSGGTGIAGESTGAFPSSTDQTVLAPNPQSERIGDFEVLGKLGQGGMGAVYRARQISLDRQVALKILPATLEADADFVARFQREARIAASLSHANLVKVYSSGLADGSHFIAMELIEGETLGQLVRRGPLSPPEALRICLDVARALQWGWDRAHLIHRDIKPGNIFLSERGEVKVGDLGLAKSMAGDTTGLTNTGTAMGTPHYISPEQARGEKDLDFRTDIYSLGCTLFQMLVGRTPYSGTDPMAVCSQHINSPPPAILKVLPSCPIPLARLVGKMLKKARRERHGSYEELISQIESVQAIFAPQESPLATFMSADPEATLLETPQPVPRSTSPRAITVAPLEHSTNPAAKFKASLYAGIALSVGVIGFAAHRLLDQGPTRHSPPHSETSIAKTSEESTVNAKTTLGARWKNLLEDPSKLTVTGGAELVSDGLRITGYGAVRTRFPKDVAIRMQTTYGGARPQLYARFDDNVGGYQLNLRDAKQVALVWRDKVGNRTVDLRTFALEFPLQHGQGYVLELWADGETLTAKINGTVLGSVTDGTMLGERVGVDIVGAQADKTVLVTAVEVLDLDAARHQVGSQPLGTSAGPQAEKSAASSAATRETPFVNSLGMKFVPVPITGGPTNGQPVLFSIWETRVDDYIKFAQEKAPRWAALNGWQKAGRPAVSVAWEDAREFCRWLTVSERVAGKISKGQTYRLPTDHEWSCAVGIGDREDALKTPAQKSGKIRDQFPWGAAWPPPNGAGNYAGAELKESKEGWVKGYFPDYSDPYTMLAPVGSFSPNKHGIFDLGGNVWEWCEDEVIVNGGDDRVLRGASYDNFQEEVMLSCRRSTGRANNGAQGGTGFRVVLAPESAGGH